MQNKSSASTYFFIGKLSDRSSRYYVSNLEIGNNLVLEVVLDNISIWGQTNREFGVFYKEVAEITNIIVSAFVFKIRKPISFIFESWVEAKDVIAKKNMIGFILNSHGKRKVYPERSKNNTGWKKAVYLYKNIKKLNNNHILALKDYRAALMDTGDDAFFFAYRAIEDICRAVSGCSDVNVKAWESMHKKLGTSKSLVVSLVDVATKIRHGDKNDPLVKTAENNKKALIEISH